MPTTRNYHVQTAAVPEHPHVIETTFAPAMAHGALWKVEPDVVAVALPAGLWLEVQDSIRRHQTALSTSDRTFRDLAIGKLQHAHDRITDALGVDHTP